MERGWGATALRWSGVEDVVEGVVEEEAQETAQDEVEQSTEPRTQPNRDPRSRIERVEAPVGFRHDYRGPIR